MERRAVAVRGIVQGVGFRPFVFGAATRLGLGGFVKNLSGSVHIEVEGEAHRLDEFLAEVAHQPPPLAHIDGIAWEPRPALGERAFRIVASEEAAGPVYFSPDVATCADCLAELFDPADRRHLYPFLNCTNCGPRLTIIRAAPYDRERTTMADFVMCPACRAEYDDPSDRRFHAQPTACAACGPCLRVLDAAGHAIVADPLPYFADALRAGRIGALKGLGGYHLVCDASNADAVAELRRRKARDEKPFALLAADADAAAELCEVDDVERILLRSAAAPIVLLRKRSPCPVADGIAPGNPSLGVMLPYSPVHHLLARLVAPLVMTSGNRSDEPIAYRDEDAVRRLGGIADVFLAHDRPIHVRCEDSVTRVLDGVELPVRRSRGYAPKPLPLPLTCAVPILATGGQLKATFALGRGDVAFPGHHLGDLDNHEAYLAFVRDVALYEQLFEVKPARIAHDLHPDYATTRYARERAAREGVALVAVQHHHAHVASCMAEHGLTEPVLGVAFDGTGYGDDGAVWGGEFLVADLSGYRRAAHLRYVGLPGADRAVKEPWRMAVAHLNDARADCPPLADRVDRVARRTVEQMLTQRINTPLTSSAGRLFDAVAALAGVRDRAGYEGQAAIELEWLALSSSADGAYPFDLDAGPWPLAIDTRPLIRAVAADVASGTDAGRIARRFHAAMAEMIRAVCRRLRDETGLGAVALSGGVFLNALLTRETTAGLIADGFRVYRHRLVPPGDGGLSLGQLAVAAARSHEGVTDER